MGLDAVLLDDMRLLRGESDEARALPTGRNAPRPL